jgi:hypothetical protein
MGQVTVKEKASDDGANVEWRWSRAVKLHRGKLLRYCDVRKHVKGNVEIKQRLEVHKRKAPEIRRRMDGNNPKPDHLS